MPDYKQATVVGQARQRCKQIVIDNSLGQVPGIRFDEERVISTEEGDIQRDAGTLAASYAPSHVVQLLNPITGEPTGKSITYGEVYAIIYSAYLDAAFARDIANLPFEGDSAP